MWTAGRAQTVGEKISKDVCIVLEMKSHLEGVTFQIAFKLILVAAVLPYFSSLLKRIFVTIIIVSFSSHDVHSILLLFSPLPFHTDDQ